MGQVGHAGGHLRANGGSLLVARIDKTWRKVCNLTPADCSAAMSLFCIKYQWQTKYQFRSR